MRDRSSGSSSSFPPHHCNPLLSLKNKTSQELRRSPIELFWTAKKQTFTCVCAFVEILQISHNIQDNFPSAVVKKTFNPVVFINFKTVLFAYEEWVQDCFCILRDVTSFISRCRFSFQLNVLYGWFYWINSTVRLETRLEKRFEENKTLQTQRNKHIKEMLH